MRRATTQVQSKATRASRLRRIFGIAVCAFASAFLAVDAASAQTSWTGNDDGSSHVIPLPDGDITVQYPNSNLWDMGEVRDSFGNILAPGNWNGPNYPNSPDTDVVIGPQVGGKSYPPTIKHSQVSVHNLTLLTGAQLALQGGNVEQGTLVAFGSIQNSGHIQLLDPGSFPFAHSELKIGPGDHLLSGGGTITMRGSAVNLNDTSNFWPRTTIQGTAADSRLVNVDNILQGSGSIGGFQTMGLANGGLVDANVPGGALALQPSALVNTGIMRASNGGILLFDGGTSDNTGGLIQAQDGGILRMRDAVVNGGMIEIKPGGAFRLDSGGINTLAGGLNVQNDGNMVLSSGELRASDALITLHDGTAFELYGGVLNGATIKSEGTGVVHVHAGAVLQGAITSDSAVFRMDGDLGINYGASLAGHTTVTSALNNRILGTHVGSSDFLAINPGAQLSLTGSGSLDIGYLGALFNHGTIDSSMAFAVLNTNVTNDGVIFAHDGAILALGNGSVLQNSGGSVVAGDNSIVRLNAVTVVDGTIKSEGTGVFQVRPGAGLQGDITSDNAVFQMESTLGISYAVNLTGHTTITSAINTSIYGTHIGSSDFLTINPGAQLTLAGSGDLNLGGYIATINNYGTLDTSVANLNFANTCEFINHGVVEVHDGGNMYRYREWTNNGNLSIDATSKASFSGQYTEDGGQTSTSGTLSAAGIVIGGNNNNGDLVVLGGTLAANEYFVVGYGAGLTGTATVSGGELTATSTYVGALGHGVLAMHGGSLTGTNFIVGDSASGSGSALISGGSVSATNLTIGRSDDGLLGVTGGSITGNIMQIGSSAGSAGAVEISGLGNVTLQDGIILSHGNASLIVSDGGTLVTNTTTFNNVGVIGGSGTTPSLGVGTATVTGAGSSWSLNLAQLQVGRSGNGTLLISDGGHVSSAKNVSATGTSGLIGVYAGSTGHATVTGAGSQWTQDGALAVGNLGQGVLDINSGGLIQSAEGFVARGAGSTGQATVTGTGSLWQISDSLYVARDRTVAGGAGTLSVADGGLVTAVNKLVVGATGTVDVNGGHLSIGEAFPTSFGPDQSVVSIGAGGTLDLTTGGAIKAGDGPFGSLPGTLQIGDHGLLAGSGTLLGNIDNLNGIVAPGFSPGILHISDHYLQGPGGQLNLEIAGLTPGTGFDQLWIGGNALLAGDINVSFLNGYLPQVGNSFDVLHVGGSFDASAAHLNFFNVPNAFEYVTTFHDGVYSLSVTAVPEPSSLALAGIGLLSTVLLARRRAIRASLTSRLSGERY